MLSRMANAYYNTHKIHASPILWLGRMSSDRSEILVQQVVALLVEARQRKELSMNKLAWMSGISPKGIAFIEQGKNSPTLRNICRLAEALGLSLPKLLADAEKSVPKKDEG